MAVIYWAGDSTAAHNSILTYPQTGIGQIFERYIKPSVRVENHAVNGRSTKSFIDEGRLAIIYDRITEGDCLFIQFGHNDEKLADPTRYAAPFGEYVDNLERFVNAARDKRAYPVIITPLTRLNYRDPGASFKHTEHAEAARLAAKKLGAPLVDLCRMSERLIDELGAEARKLYMHIPAGVYRAFPDGLTDGTHLQPKGALMFGGLIARGLLELGGQYAELLADGLGEALMSEARLI